MCQSRKYIYHKQLSIKNKSRKYRSLVEDVFHTIVVLITIIYQAIRGNYNKKSYWT